MNVVTMMGRLTKDVGLQYYGNNNTAVARFSIAVQRNFKDKDGKYGADFINCQAFGKTAETIEKYFHKGSRILAIGEWRTGNYTDKNGNKVYTNDFAVNRVEFVDSKSENGQQRNDNPNPNPMPSNADGFMQIPDSIDEELPFS